MRCIVCGEEASIEVFCENCYSKDHKVFEIKDFSIEYCKHCDNYYIDKTYVEIEDVIKKRIKEIIDIKKIDVKYRKIGNQLRVKINCEGKIKGVKKYKSEEKNIGVRVYTRKCLTCSRLSGGYYEAVVQVRNDEALKEIQEMNLENATILNVKDGHDIKFMRKKDAGKTVKMLKGEYAVIKTAKLAGEKKGKKLYRNYYSVK